MSTRTHRSRVLRIKVTATTPESSLPALPQQQRPKPALPLEIYELLECILQWLPMRDVLLAQGVCRRWRDVIGSSSCLQRQLYLQAEPLLDTNCISYAPNPLLACAFEGRFHYSPSLLRHTPTNLANLISGIPPQYLTLCKIVLNSNCSGWKKSFARPEASWRRMYMTRPAVTSVGVVDQRIAPDWDDVWEEQAFDEAGVRLGDLLRLEEHTR